MNKHAMPKGILKTNTAITLAGITMKNPVATASGTFGYGLEMAKIWDLSLLGALVVKSISTKPWRGAPTPRIVETPAGMLNAIGLQNPGIDAFINSYLPKLLDELTTGKRVKISPSARGRVRWGGSSRKNTKETLNTTPLIVNIVGNTVDEFRELAEKLDPIPGIAGLEVNASCPNYQGGNLPFCVTTKAVSELIQTVKKATKLPVFIKLSPNVTDIVEIAKASESAGADGIAMINTLIGMKIDTRTKKPFIGFKTGGLSGPAIHPVGVRMVWQVAQEVKIPILGMGGIATAEDAIEFIMAGATAVAVGTANFTDPWACPKIIKGIEKWMKENSVKDINEIRGASFNHSD